MLSQVSYRVFGQSTRKRSMLRQWVREEDLAKDLKLHLKQLRRTLRFFEEEKLVTRDHRKETAKGAKAYSAAVAATADNLPGRDGEEKIKLHTHSYCCLDYAQVSLSLSLTGSLSPPSKNYLS
ncbi:putative transcription initiation factor IIE subunit alpha, TFIIEalpha/SarR/Rpc3 HTH [Helianthus anomalus]